MSLTPKYRGALRRVSAARKELDAAERDAHTIWMEEQE